MIESFWSTIGAENDKSSVDSKLYEQMIGSLFYLALRSRPDILRAVLILAGFQKSPTACCHLAIKRVFRYLLGTSSHGIHYRSGSLVLNGFVDSDYPGDTMERKSLSGFVLKLG